MLLLGVIPSPEDILNDNYFREPLFLGQLLFDLSKIYGFDKVPNRILEQLHLSDLEQDNIIINTNILFSSFMILDADLVLAVVNSYLWDWIP